MRQPLRAPVLVTGFGLGAFLDGIVLHQVLRWHHLVSAYELPDDLAALERNTFWDGVFHLGAWCVVLAGVLLVFRRRAELPALGPRRFAGWLLVGWGAFNVADQAVFHLALEAHHIRMVEDHQLYDWGYTALGVLLAAAGAALVRSESSAS